MKKTSPIIITSIALIIIVSTIIFIIYASPEPKKLVNRESQASYNFGGDFILTDQDGKKFNSAKYHDKLQLIYFGFTYCPDVCPAELIKIVDILGRLDNNPLIQTLFITIDPKRDTVYHLKEYLSLYNDEIIGLTGEENQVKPVADLFKVYFSFSKENDRDVINHSSLTYLMHKGKVVKYFAESEGAEYIAAEIKNVILQLYPEIHQ
jgi:protein SCO1/2